MSRRYFGTDGVRGTYGGPVMNVGFAARLGAAAARFAREDLRAEALRVFIGRDTRASGAALEAALGAGLAAGGLEPLSLGVVPTPAVSLAVRREGAALGAVITASHNPAADNGIKFFGPAGIKLTDDEELRIEELLPVDTAAIPSLAGDVAAFPSGASLYIRAVEELLPPGSLRDWSVVLDTANGAGTETSRAVLAGLGARLERIGASPNGRNINARVGSEHPAQLCGRVRRIGARLGIAHDGDADRCILCDENGELLDGDEILTILALHALSENRLPGRTLVVTVQSNLGVDEAVTAAGGRVCRTPVGDRYVIERMLREQAELGGESSGHVICFDVTPTGDGLVAALKVMGVMLATGRPLSDLRRQLRKFPQATLALEVKEKVPIERLPILTRAIRELESSLGARGRVLVRYSGTEPKIRLLVEGPSEEQVRHGVATLQSAVRTELEVVG